MRYILGMVLILYPMDGYSIEQDKMLHASVSALASITLYTALRRANIPKVPASIASAFLVMSAGLIKETRDDHADIQDIKANAIGTALGTGFNLVINF